MWPKLLVFADSLLPHRAQRGRQASESQIDPRSRLTPHRLGVLDALRGVYLLKTGLGEMITSAFPATSAVNAGLPCAMLEEAVFSSSSNRL